MSWNNRGISNSDNLAGKKSPAGVENAAPMLKSKSESCSRKKAKRAMRRGLISEKAAKKHLADY